MFYISFIDAVGKFASDPSGEKLEDVLIDALFVGFGLYLNGFGDETSGGKGYIDVLKETFPDFFEKTGDMGIEDEVAAKLIEKSPSESATLEEIETFKGQGLSNERISEICENLNTEEIDIFKDILNDNPGKYTDADYAKIQNLLEQCGTKSEMDGLRNDIDRLDEYGIKPSDYESRGINTPERVEGAAEAVGRQTERILDTVADSNIVNRVEEIRSLLPSDLKRGGNVALAEVEIPGIKSEFYAHNQIDVLADARSAADRVTDISLKPTNPVFTATEEVTADGRIVLRDIDSEYKILNDIANQLGDNVNVTGRIQLFTELECCPSCKNVIIQFLEKYKNITIKVINNQGTRLIP